MSGYQILVVDDDDTQRAMVADYLSLAGFPVREAAGGEQALAIMRASPPDFVVLDVNMPGLDGISVVREMRRQPALSEVPVLFLSSVEARHIRVRALELGGDDFVTKPCEPPELLARIRVGLRRAARYHRHRVALAGTIGDGGMTIEDVVQTLLLGMRSARVEFPEVPASLTCHAGAIVACSYGALTGADALARLLWFGHGPFEVGFDAAPPPPAEPAGHGLALMSALVAIDETRALLGDLGPEQWLAATSAGAESFFRQRARGPQSVRALLGELPGDLRAAARVITTALERGHLHRVGDQTGVTS